MECKTFKWTDSGNHLRLPQGEAEAWQRDRDPMALYERRLCEMGVLNDAMAGQFRARVDARVEAAIASARRSPGPSPEDGLDDVYAVPDLAGFENLTGAFRSRAGP